MSELPQSAHFFSEHLHWLPGTQYGLQPRPGVPYRFTPTLPKRCSSIELAAKMVADAEDFYTQQAAEQSARLARRESALLAHTFDAMDRIMTSSER